MGSLTSESATTSNHQTCSVKSFSLALSPLWCCAWLRLCHSTPSAPSTTVTPPAPPLSTSRSTLGQASRSRPSPWEDARPQHSSPLFSPFKKHTSFQEHTSNTSSHYEATRRTNNQQFVSSQRQ